MQVIVDRVDPGEGGGLEREFESGVVEIFSDLAELFGNQRSVGAIYGLLFSSVSALTLGEICKKLGVSQGSASQGIRLLESFGVVVREKSAKNKSAHFCAKMELKTLIAGFLRERVMPRIQLSRKQLQGMEKTVEQMNANSKEFADFRLKRMKQWYERVDLFFPVLRRLLGD